MTDEPHRRRERWLIRGRVQGVGYRAFTEERAVALGLGGWVRNLPDGGVEAVVCGGEATLARLEHDLRQGPPAARVELIERRACDASESIPERFEVRRTPRQKP
jgi:acylphosphatase